MHVGTSDGDENSEPLQTATASPDAEQPVTLPDRLDPLTSDEPLPQIYGSEQIGLLVQSPEKLFLHWNYARDPGATLIKALGEAASKYRPAVRLIEVESGEEFTRDADGAGTHWFDAKPGCDYQADVGFIAEGLPFLRVLSSAVVQTPRPGVSQIIDEAQEFHITAPDFASVLSEAGYAADALGVALEIADAETAGTVSPEIVATLTDIELPSLDESGQSELRGLIIALALGRSPHQLLGTLSTPLARWLEQLIRREGGAVDPAPLLELLRETFGFELRFDESSEERPLVLGEMETRSSWGASLVHFGSAGERFPVRTPRVWLPGMAPRLVSKMLAENRPPRAPSSFTMPRSARLEPL